MHTVKAFGLEVLTIPDPPAQASGSSGHPPSTGGLESDSAHRAATLRELAKQACKSADSQHFVGRHKWAKTVQPEQVIPPNNKLPLPPDDNPPFPPDHEPPPPN
ncbi:hypothetical protein BDR06DRAFT_1012026 [Suillus hirtellus]|nr:hypothetical protein BDR06DRAFT_1012026 [Suillus hirtellus]